MAKPGRAVGAFFAMSLDLAVLIVRKPLAWREFLLQSWCVARVSLLPTRMLAGPLSVGRPSSCGRLTPSISKRVAHN
jgi:phospholipid/cholesterol/gamma-HCH transport system permease protein